MKIDLSKLIYNNIYKISINEELIIPKDNLNGTDIKKISPVNVNGYVAYNDEEYSLEVTISGVMTLLCARTLKDVEYPFNIEINEVIGENNDNSLEIVQNSLEIFPIIWQYILME